MKHPILLEEINVLKLIQYILSENAPVGLSLLIFISVLHQSSLTEFTEEMNLVVLDLKWNQKSCKFINSW